MKGNSKSSNKPVKEMGESLTRQRQIVLEVIQSSDEHLTANEVFDASRQLMPTISQATVYNSLRYLKEAGMISEITFGNGASRFDKETCRHDHAICKGCGRLTDFDLPETVELMRSAARRSRFQAESIHLTLVGFCPDCRKD
jgi:Fur family peroxide stress response transcriptional regulator